MPKIVRLAWLLLLSACGSTNPTAEGTVLKGNYKALAGCAYLSMRAERLDVQMAELTPTSIEVAQDTMGAQSFRVTFSQVGGAATRVQIAGSKQTPAERLQAFVQDCVPS